MKTFKTLLIALLGLNPLFLLSQITITGEPIYSQLKLIELQPNKFYIQNIIPSAHTSIPDMEFTVAEYESFNMWLHLKIETNLSDIELSNAKVFFKKEDQFEEVQLISWTQTSISVQVKSGHWLTNDWPIEVYVVADGIRSNSINLIVVDHQYIPPTITSLKPDHIAVTKEPTRITIFGKNFGVEGYTSVKINGIDYPVDSDHNFADGWTDVYLPQAVRETDGVYSVILKTKFGESNPVNLIVGTPPIYMAPIPTVLTSTNWEKPIPETSVELKKNNRKQFQSKKVARRPVSGLGIIIYLNGTTSEPHKAYLGEYIGGLDQVKIIENNFTLATDEKVIITIQGFDVPIFTMEYVKRSIEDKIKELGIQGDVVIE